jgi:hypothetical protein
MTLQNDIVSRRIAEFGESYQEFTGEATINSRLHYQLQRGSMPDTRTPKTRPRPKVADGISTGRVFWIGTLLILFSAFFGTYAFVVVQALLWTQTSLLRGPVVILFALVLLNLLVRRLARRFSLSQAELLVVYGMVCIGTCAAGIGFVQFLVNQMASPFYYVSKNPQWESQLWPHIPSWLGPRAPEVIAPFYRGNDTFYQAPILAGWAIPVLAWSAFIFTLFWTLLCILTLLRRQWIEEERLTFPLVALPMEMTDMHTPGGFWKNRLMWAGFLVAGLAESLNFLHFLYPAVPMLPIKPVGPNILDQNLTTFPWNQMGQFRLAFYPFAIGIAYLLPLDMSFSCWFFYLCVKAANIMSAMMGYSEGGGGGTANRAPYLREQSVGAFIALALLSVWMARRALARAWQEVKRPTGADRNELMSFRLAFVGGGAGLVLLMGFLVAAGLPLQVVALYLFFYFCFAITLTRIVSEVGAGWAFGPNWTATTLTTDVFGANSLSDRTITIFQGYTNWMSADLRDNPMPQQAQALKTGQLAEASPRRFLWPLVWACAFGVFCAFWAHLHVYYIYGASSSKVRPWLQSVAVAPFRDAMTMLSTPTQRDVTGIIASLFGAVILLVLSALRQRFTSWPFHPIGYAVATTNSLDYFWFPFFLAWIAKGVTLRYGGIQMYRRFLPFFLGLILGDYVVPALWGLGGMLTGNQQYMAFPH